MCISVNRASINTQVDTVNKGVVTDTELKVKKENPLDIIFNSINLSKNFEIKDEMGVSSYPDAKQKNYLNIPIYTNEDSVLRLSEATSNSAKMEIGKPNQKALITFKIRNEETSGNPEERSNINSKPKISIDSPYLKDKIRDFAKETVMNHVVEPLRGAMGKTAADITLGAVVVATALVSAKHVPDGNLKVNLPVKFLTGESDFRAKVILGYGDGKNLKPSGIELRDSFNYRDQKIDIRASFRKDAEVNGIKDVGRTQVEAIIINQKEKWGSGAISMSISHDKVIGTSAGIFYQKSF